MKINIKKMSFENRVDYMLKFLILYNRNKLHELDSFLMFMFIFIIALLVSPLFFIILSIMVVFMIIEIINNRKAIKELHEEYFELSPRGKK
jgi:hypothetical protein